MKKVPKGQTRHYHSKGATRTITRGNPRKHKDRRLEEAKRALHQLEEDAGDWSKSR